VLNRIDQESDRTFFITGYFTKSKNSEKNTVFRPYQNAPFLCLRSSHLLSLRPATKGCISLDAHFNEEFDKQNLISVN